MCINTPKVKMQIQIQLQYQAENLTINRQVLVNNIIINEQTIYLPSKHVLGEIKQEIINQLEYKNQNYDQQQKDIAIDNLISKQYLQLSNGDDIYICTPFVAIQFSNDNKTIEIVTDQFGQIPLLYYQLQNQLIITNQSTPYIYEPKHIQPGITKLQIMLQDNSINITEQIIHKYAYKLNLYDNNMKSSINNYAIQLNNIMQQNLIQHFTQKQVTLLFSGGIDSVLILLNLIKAEFRVNLLTLSFMYTEPEKRNSNSDLEAVQNILQQLKTKGYDQYIQPHFIFIEEEQFKNDINVIKQLIQPVNPRVIDVNLGSVFFYVSKYSSENLKCNTVISGLGPDEFFAGYYKNRKQHNTQAVEKAVDNIFSRNIIRDYKVYNGANVIAYTPYLSDGRILQLVKDAYQTIPVEDLSNKMIVRAAAQQFHILDDSIVMRPKRAAQFGSGISKIIEKDGYDQL